MSAWKAKLQSLDLELLERRANHAYSKGRFALEVVYREEIFRRDPANPHAEHNLALSLMHCGEWDRALRIFEQLVEVHPHLSRAHNNRAVLLIWMGAEWHALIPAFMAAVLTSEDLPSFMRHLFNVSRTIAYGLDEGAYELLEMLREELASHIAQRSEPRYRESNAKVVSDIIAAFQAVAEYRKAFARKQWTAANAELTRAEALFRARNLHQFADRFDAEVRPYFDLARDTAQLLELIGHSAMSLPAAREQCVKLHERAVPLHRGPEYAHGQFLEVLGWFLYGSIRAFNYLIEPENYEMPDELAETNIARLTAHSYREFGGELDSCLRFYRKQCMRIAHETSQIASFELLEKYKEEAWQRIKIFLNGLVLDFRGVDTALARQMIGWPYDPVEAAKRELRQFKSFIERQAAPDIFVHGKPQENIARALLQAFLVSRSYREVPVRGGQSDLMVFSKDGRFLYETKIWRGTQNHEQGLREIEEYLVGEDDDGELSGTFYVVFDATRTQMAAKRVGGDWTEVEVAGRAVRVMTVNLAPPQPSRKPP
ncbi:MAG TPA: hypothetical protein VHG08_00285 [Longimicrobium sp.]|nr:hypothetical protein [Longimicrobium sp.]